MAGERAKAGGNSGDTGDNGLGAGRILLASSCRGGRAGRYSRAFHFGARNLVACRGWLHRIGPVRSSAGSVEPVGCCRRLRPCAASFPALPVLEWKKTAQDGRRRVVVTNAAENPGAPSYEQPVKKMDRVAIVCQSFRGRAQRQSSR